MSNRELLTRGLEVLADGLRPFIDRQMTATMRNGEDWIAVLAERDGFVRRARQYNSLADPRFLLRVLTEQRRVFDGQITRADQSYASELRDTGNRWAHGEAFSDDDTYRALDTMERLLNAVGAQPQATLVRALRTGQSRAEDPPEETSGSGRVGATNPRQRRTSSSPTAASWAHVSRADVIRAIEEYDRLGQDRFLDEHGFGRATAYLLIYNDRSYDSKAIAGVAYERATGLPMGSHEFSGGIHGAAKVLLRLGFEVRNVRDDRATMSPD